MPLAETLTAGGVILGATVVTFFAVSFVQLKDKIDGQVGFDDAPSS